MRWWLALSWALRIVGWLLLADAVGMAPQAPFPALVKAVVGAWFALESRLPPPPPPPR
jgi:hypothetical protein